MHSDECTIAAVNYGGPQLRISRDSHSSTHDSRLTIHDSRFTIELNKDVPENVAEVSQQDS